MFILSSRVVEGELVFVNSLLLGVFLLLGGKMIEVGSVWRFMLYLFFFKLIVILRDCYYYGFIFSVYIYIFSFIYLKDIY